MKGRIPVNLSAPWWSPQVEDEVKATLPGTATKQKKDDARTLRLGLHNLQTDDHVLTGLRLYASQPTRKVSGYHHDQGHIARISYVLGQTPAHLMTQGHVNAITNMALWPSRITHGMKLNRKLHKKTATRGSTKRLLQVLSAVIDVEWKEFHICNPAAPPKPIVNVALARNRHPTTKRTSKPLSSQAIRSAQAMAHTHGSTARIRQRNEALHECKQATNFRVPELASLDLNSVKSMKDGGLRFTAQEGKTHNVRTRRCGKVPATRAWFDLRQGEGDSDVLWTDDNGEALTIREIKKIITAMGDTPYGQVNPHDWKRWDLGLRSAMGQSRQQVAGAAHHGPRSCTSTYIHPSDDILYLAVAPAWGISPYALGDCCRTCGALDYVTAGYCPRHHAAPATPQAVNQAMEELGLQALEDLGHLRDAIEAAIAAKAAQRQEQQDPAGAAA